MQKLTVVTNVAVDAADVNEKESCYMEGNDPKSQYFQFKDRKDSKYLAMACENERELHQFDLGTGVLPFLPYLLPSGILFLVLYLLSFPRLLFFTILRKDLRVS